MTEKGVLDNRKIQEILPHRYPFLLVDRILELEPGVRAVGMKAVTINEQFFMGHFPGHPVMPGVMVIEFMAQIGGIMMLSVEEHKGKLAYLAAIENVRFRMPVVPGDVLTCEVALQRVRGNMGKVKITAKVGDQIVCEGEIMFALVGR